MEDDVEPEVVNPVVIQPIKREDHPSPATVTSTDGWSQTSPEPDVLDAQTQTQTSPEPDVLNAQTQTEQTQ